MNERIKELANKANAQVGYNFKLEDAKQLHELMENFAELIIKECAEIANENVGLFTPSCGNSVLEHFGVK